MKVIVHDLDSSFAEMIGRHCDRAVAADGRYAPCQGCFGCWTGHPAECFMKDSLQQACRVLGTADELVVVTENLYGSFSADIKNVMDRSIGTSTPFSTYRGGEMHHTLRYGMRPVRRVIVYGDITEKEKETFLYTAQRNAVNEGYEKSDVIFIESTDGLEALL